MVTLAQVASQIEDLKPLMQWGLTGAVVYWLIHKNDANMEKIREAVVDSGARMEHKLQGLSRTMLIDILTRKELHPDAERMAKQELDKTNAAYSRPDPQ